MAPSEAARHKFHFVDELSLFVIKFDFAELHLRRACPIGEDKRQRDVLRFLFGDGLRDLGIGRVRIERALGELYDVALYRVDIDRVAVAVISETCLIKFPAVFRHGF